MSKFIVTENQVEDMDVFVWNQLFDTIEKAQSDIMTYLNKCNVDIHPDWFNLDGPTGRIELKWIIEDIQRIFKITEISIESDNSDNSEQVTSYIKSLK